MNSHGTRALSPVMCVTKWLHRKLAEAVTELSDAGSDAGKRPDYTAATEADADRPVPRSRRPDWCGTGGEFRFGAVLNGRLRAWRIVGGMDTRRSLNVIEVSGKAFLLTATAGDAVHLTREADSGEARQAAVPDHYMRDFEQIYNMAAILEPKWAETTLCGRPWILMEGDHDDEDWEATYAPTCRRCLALMDKLFPAPRLDDRFPLVVQLITDTIVEYGTAEILSVPGDQQAALRKQVRSAVRKRTGHELQTHAHESMVIFVCDPIYQQHAAEYSRQVAGAISAVINGEVVEPPPSPTRLSWDAWATK